MLASMIWDIQCCYSHENDNTHNATELDGVYFDRATENKGEILKIKFSRILSSNQINEKSDFVTILCIKSIKRKERLIKLRTNFSQTKNHK